MQRLLEEIKQDMLALEDPIEPKVKRFRTDNSSIEKLHELLSHNPRGILVHRDELKGLLASLDKEEKAGERAFYLEGWSGGGAPYYVDRIGRGTVCAENGVCLSVLGGIQPGKLLAYLSQAIGENENDGLLQRFQIMVYPDSVEWQHVDKAPNRIAIATALDIVEKLADMDFVRFGASIQAEGEIPFFHFDSEAQAIFDDWLIELQTIKLAAKDHPVILEHLSKYQKLVPALALCFHLIELANGGKPGPIRKESMARAADWADYLEFHARRIYGLILNSNQGAKRLSEKILKREIADGFTARDIYNNDWSQLDSVEKAEGSIEILFKAKWLRKKIIQPTKDGGRGSVQYFINPKVHSNG